MTRSYQIINTSNWSDEPLEVLFDGSQLNKLLINSGESTGDLNLDIKAKTVTVQPVRGTTPSAAVFNEAGEQLYPHVDTRWLRANPPLAAETDIQLEKARDENQRLAQRVSDLSTANERLRNERDEMKAVHAEQVEARDSWKGGGAKFNELNRQIRELKAENDKLDARGREWRDELRRQIEEKDAEIAELKAEENLRSTVNDLEKHRGSLLDDLAKRDVQVANQKGTIQDLTADRDNMQEQYGKAIDTIDKMANQITNEKATIKDLTHERDEAFHSIQELETACAKWQEAHRLAVDGWKDEKAGVEKRLVETTNRVHSLRAELATANLPELERMGASLRKAKRQRDRAIKARDRLAVTVEGMEETIANQQAEIEKAATAIVELKAEDEARRSDSAARRLQDENRKLRRENVGLNGKVQTIRRAVLLD